MSKKVAVSKCVTSPSYPPQVYLISPSPSYFPRQSHQHQGQFHDSTGSKAPVSENPFLPSDWPLFRFHSIVFIEKKRKDPTHF